jgi:predicted regulator of Ras-like GTPase activity (Roadblock/LC7/MglB family)
MHVKKAEKADCSKMDHSKMDMKDPVAIAMMKKCMKQAEKSKDKMDHGKMDHSKVEKKDGDNEHNH